MPAQDKEYMLSMVLYERTKGEPNWLVLQTHTHNSPFKSVVTAMFKNALRVIKGYH